MDKMSEAYKGKEAEVYEKLVSKYFDYEKIAENLDKVLQLQMVINPYQKVPDSFTLIELGVGTGRLAEEMVNLGHRVLGLDTSGDMIKIAINNFDKKYKNIPYFWKNLRIVKQSAEEFLINKGEFMNFFSGSSEAIYSHSGPITLMKMNGELYVRIDSKDKLEKIIDKTFDNLENGGLFLINIETPGDFETELPNNEYAGVKIHDLGINSGIYKRTHYHGTKKGIDHEIKIESLIIDQEDLFYMLRKKGFSEKSGTEEAEKTGWVWARK